MRFIVSAAAVGIAVVAPAACVLPRHDSLAIDTSDGESFVQWGQSYTSLEVHETEKGYVAYIPGTHTYTCKLKGNRKLTSNVKRVFAEKTESDCERLCLLEHDCVMYQLDSKSNCLLMNTFDGVAEGGPEDYVSPANCDESCFKHAEVYDNQYETKSDVVSPFICRVKCQEDVRCNAFNYNSVTSECHLSGKGATASPADRLWISGSPIPCNRPVVSGAPPCYTGLALQVYPFQYVESKNQAHCHDNCRREPWCAAFSRAHDRLCYFSDISSTFEMVEAKPSVSGPHMKCGTMEPIDISRLLVARGAVLKGATFLTMEQVGFPYECRAACQKRLGCDAFVWNKDENTCKLISGDHTSTMEFEDGSIYGGLRDAETTCYKIHERYTAKPYYTEDEPMISCVARCRFDGNCKGFSWTVGKCELFDSDETTTEASLGTFSGPKEPCTRVRHIITANIPDGKCSFGKMRNRQGSVVLREQPMEARDDAACQVQCRESEWCTNAVFNEATNKCELFATFNEGFERTTSDDIYIPASCDYSCFDKRFKYEGKTTKELEGVEEVFECFTACAGDHTCNAWSFDNETKLCQFFENPIKMIYSENAFSGGKQDCARPTNFVDETHEPKFRTGISIRDGVIVAAENVSACRQACLDDITCVAMTYNTQKSKCYLHKSIKTTYDITENDIFYTRDISTRCFSNGTVPVKPVRIVANTTPSLCHAGCTNEAKCAFFEYDITTKDCKMYPAADFIGNFQAGDNIVGRSGPCH